MRKLRAVFRKPLAASACSRRNPPPEKSSFLLDNGRRYSSFEGIMTRQGKFSGELGRRCLVCAEGDWLSRVRYNRLVWRAGVYRPRAMESKESC